MPANRIQQLVRVPQKGLVPEPKDDETGFRQLQVSLGVLNLPKAVDSSIELDDELGLRTEEAGDRASKRSLTAEFQTLEMPAAEHLP